MPRITFRHPAVYHGRSLVAGDTLEVTPIEAAILRRAGHALDSDLSAPKAEPPKAKRRYRRRDLRAEE